ncbi:MAG TPA: hypothetical protein V6C81_07165 [Planktothrix sp.]|jgi:hypothetical protein
MNPRNDNDDDDELDEVPEIQEAYRLKREAMQKAWETLRSAQNNLRGALTVDLQLRSEKLRLVDKIAAQVNTISELIAKLPQDAL